MCEVFIKCVRLSWGCEVIIEFLRSPLGIWGDYQLCEIVIKCVCEVVINFYEVIIRNVKYVVITCVRLSSGVCDHNNLLGCHQLCELVFRCMGSSSQIVRSAASSSDFEGVIKYVRSS